MPKIYENIEESEILDTAKSNMVYQEPIYVRKRGFHDWKKWCVLTLRDRCVAVYEPGAKTLTVYA